MPPVLTDFFKTCWTTRSWKARLLWPLSQFYLLLIAFRARAYCVNLFKSQRFPVPVVVVGNVVVGGAGKTPLVIALVRHLCTQGLQVGVVSRGFGRSTRQTLEVVPAMTAKQSGDEPALIKRATDAPIFVARHRSDAIRMLLQNYPATDVVITDDGLQHLALQRDIEVVVFDDRGIGNGWMLPAGPLREPWPRPAGRAKQMLLHTGLAPAFAGFTSSRRLGSHAVAADGRRVLLDDLRGMPLTALAAIASPEAFFSMLRSRGLRLANTVVLPDHDDFEFFDLRQHAGSTVVCTEKDAVKLFAKAAPANLNLLAVPLIFEPEPAFFMAFDSLLTGFLSPLPSDHGHQTS